MDEVFTVRRTRLRELLKSSGHNQRELADLIGCEQSYVSRMLARTGKNQKNIGEDYARRIESALGKPRGWLDGEESPKSQKSAQEVLGLSAEAIEIARRWQGLSALLRRQIAALIDAILAEPHQKKKPRTHRNRTRAA